MGTSGSAASSGPATIYRERAAERQESSRRLAGRELAVSNARIAVAAGALVIGWAWLGRGALGWGWLALPAAAFIVLVVLHERAIRARRRADRAAAFYERGLARLEDRWAGTGEAGARFLDPEHPFSADLDLFGPGSLFELLSTARTRAGESTLAAWLLRPAGADVVTARQQAVRELRPRLDLREDLALLGDEVGAGVHPDELAAWGKAPPVELPGAVRWLAPLLAVANLAALAVWVIASLALPFVIAVTLSGALGLALRARVRRVVAQVELPGRDLALLAEVLARIESESFECPHLRSLQEALRSAGRPPSRRIARLGRLIELLDARRNQLFAPLALLLFWATQLALAIERWRAATGPAIERWLDAVGEFEALASLAGLSFERPEDPFPEVLRDGCVFEAVALGHPLLPAADCVSNDLTLGDEMRLLVVSGSNMSGKSTLLRTVGINAVLALAGAPVRAASLRLSRFALGATLRIQDSLREGRSRFYAEITRLRRLMDITDDDPPLLFLLDEILHGTNSHDRGIGAEGIVRGLLDRGAVGLLTTHDLALARIADALAPLAANVHFEDRLERGRIVFDYRLRPGVVRRSNALELMRSVGLDIPEEQGP